MKHLQILAFLFIGLISWSQEPNPDRALKVVLPDVAFPFHPLVAETSVASQVFSGLFEGLLDLDPSTLAPVPAIAEAWTFSRDGKILTLKLRPNIKYSDGSPLVAQDFLESWKVLLEPRGNRSFATLFDDVVNAVEYRTGKITDFSQVGVSVNGPSEIVIRLVRPAPHFLSILAHYSFHPVHSSIRNSRNPSITSLICNGPYKVKSFAGKRLIMERNPNYWDRANVAIAQVEIQFTDDSENVTRAYSRGEVDWIDGVFDGDFVINRENIVVAASFASSYFYFNSAQAPYSDYRVRRALALLVDPQALREEQILGTTALIPPIPPYTLAQGIDERNQEEAERLLAESGFPLGRGLPELKFFIPEEGEILQRMVKVLEKSWEKYVKVAIVTSPWSQYHERTKTEDFTVAYQSWIGDFPDPLTFLLMWETGSSLNTARFSDPEYDRLLEESRGKTRINERFQVLGRAENYLLQRAALIPVAFGASFHLIDRANVGGWFPNPLDFHPFKRMFFQARRALPNLAMAFPGF